MKKIVFLNGRFLTQPITGVQRTAFEIVSALDSLIDANTINKEHLLFILIYSGEIINPIQLKHIRIQKKGLFSGNFWEQVELPFYTFGHFLISMCTVSTLLKRKQIVIVHDASFVANPQFFSFIFRTWYKFAIPILGKISKQIVTVSEFSKSELIKHLGFRQNKISVILNAADHVLKYAEPDRAFKNRIEKLKPYCLAVSSLSDNKNFYGLSKAISKIDIKNFKMVIAGGANKNLNRSASGDAVIYLGYVKNSELKFLYENASLFIFPSFYEGFGIPPLEAMILGCPVIASNTSSMPEVLGDACAYCDPHSPDNMAFAINSLVGNSERLMQLKSRGYERAAKYSWNKSALKLYELINKYSEKN